MMIFAEGVNGTFSQELLFNILMALHVGLSRPRIIFTGCPWNLYLWGTGGKLLCTTDNSAVWGISCGWVSRNERTTGMQQGRGASEFTMVSVTVIKL